jgi:hypothetical protein
MQTPSQKTETQRRKEGYRHHRGLRAISREKKWFDEVCATVDEEKNCTRAAKLTAMNEYQASLKMEKRLLRKIKEQFDEQALIEI